MTIYKHGCVKASRIVMNVKQQTSSAIGSMLLVPVNTSSGSGVDLLTNPMVAESMLSLNQPMFTFDMTMQSHTMTGLKSFEEFRSSVNHWFTAASSPTSQVFFWRAAYSSVDGSTSVVAYTDTRIYYDVVFFERNVADVDYDEDTVPAQQLSRGDHKHADRDAITSLGEEASEVSAPAGAVTPVDTKSVGGESDQDIDEAMYARLLAGNGRLSREPGATAPASMSKKLLELSADKLPPPPNLRKAFRRVLAVTEQLGSKAKAMTGATFEANRTPLPPQAATTASSCATAAPRTGVG